MWNRYTRPDDWMWESPIKVGVKNRKRWRGSVTRASPNPLSSLSEREAERERERERGFGEARVTDPLH